MHKEQGQGATADVTSSGHPVVTTTVVTITVAKNPALMMVEFTEVVHVTVADVVFPSPQGLPPQAPAADRGHPPPTNLTTALAELMARASAAAMLNTSTRRESTTKFAAPASNMAVEPTASAAATASGRPVDITIATFTSAATGPAVDQLTVALTQGQGQGQTHQVATSQTIVPALAMVLSIECAPAAVTPNTFAKVALRQRAGITECSVPANIPACLVVPPVSAAVTRPGLARMKS